MRHPGLLWFLFVVMLSVMGCSACSTGGSASERQTRLQQAILHDGDMDLIDLLLARGADANAKAVVQFSQYE